MTISNAPALGWWSKLKGGLKKSSARLNDGLKVILTHRKLDQELLDELEELLITHDLGVNTANQLTKIIAQKKFGQDITLEEVKQLLAEEITTLLKPVALSLIPSPSHQPHVVLVVGVNGSGKTTTISKLAQQWTQDQLQVHLAAGDTFRAAAAEQLKIWADRIGIPITVAHSGQDSAALTFDALTEAKTKKAEVLLIDTAGRLHNKSDLMAELQKIIRVIKKIDPTAPHTTLLILDATIGQNSLQQVQVFQDMISLDGLIMTKLDGTAKGGIVVALAEKFCLPIYALGIGESIEDLRPFSAEQFAHHLMGLQQI